MTVRVCSLMWGSAWERYGEKFAKSFAKHWPSEVELIIVTDRNLPIYRGRQIDILNIEGYAQFRAFWAGDPEANGRNCPPDCKVDETGYSWKRDAVKWMPQALAPHAAAHDLDDGDIFVWMDADVETVAPVPSNWVEIMLGDADVACLQRPGTHTEIGFYAMRMGPDTRAVLRLFSDLYTRGTVFNLREQHSAFVWDRAVESRPGLKIKNLNTSGGKGHVFPASPLHACLIHRKGKRKDCA